MSLISDFDGSTVILTANSRLAQSLKHDALGDRAVSVLPQIMSFSQWWNAWLDEVILAGELSLEQMSQRHLNAFEAQVLWEEVLQQELNEWVKLSADNLVQEDDIPEPIELLNPSSTAKQLYQAWSLQQGWLDDALWQTTLAQGGTSKEVALFERCQQRYRQLLQRHNWLDEPLLSQQRLVWLAQGKGRLPLAFNVVGFDELTPELLAWQTIVQQRGVKAIIELPTLSTAAIQTQNTAHALYMAADAVDEAQQVALWCVEQWQRLSQCKDSNQNPNQKNLRIKIGVVAPNLADHKALLTQALDEQLYLAGLQPLRSVSVQPPFYNLSLGEPLSQLPLVKNALLGVELLLQPHKTCSFANWSQWLISPYTLGDLNARQTLEAKWRGLQWAEFKWPKLLDSATPALQEPGLAKFKNALEQQANITLASRLTLREFVQAVRACLDLFNQPLRTLNSDEYQQNKALQSALEAFSRLLFLKPSARLGDWLSRLKRFLGEQVHQSQSKGLQPIQLMGVLEAGGQHFDALWVMGLTDEAWPRSPNPNPFLPMRLQRQAGLPRCDALRELVYAQSITARLKTAATNTVWSYPQQTAGAVLLPSPLLSEMLTTPYVPRPYQTLAQWSFMQRDVAAPLEWIEDAQAPAMPEHSQAPGGTSILAAQSQCPLMAFIDYRLGARYGLQTVTDGLQNTHQGTLIHWVLERFWQVTRTQSALLALSQTALEARLNELITQAFSELHGQLTAAYLHIEQARIGELCLAWLNLEKTRPSFEVVALETQQLIHLAGIEFKVIIDRVDRVNAQSGTPQMVILDYKTGAANITNLLKTPTKAPQLAVYLHALQSLDSVSDLNDLKDFNDMNNIGGIGYGLLHSDDGAKISALCQAADILPDSRTITVFSKLADKEGGDYYQVAWSDFLDALREQVFTLALHIKQGVAPMQFDRLEDVQYAHGRLALRLPEVAAQLNQVGALKGEADESEGVAHE
ncbi:PD-(D/E)XK nuclease family protein [Thiomicrorhabdus aquaedulcis]|uniref:PD-(D/E)XK nuclease family protein n=1 Tax=Thiomicrorhabdus aquaedulcis TaxID=2211106 RepID=UPI000FDCBA78|nr:PD-(D/E)XK nuclease family protein [Thiomicrorhabdus aquaedulcis]